MKLNRCPAYIAIIIEPQTVQKIKILTKAQHDLNPGSYEEKNETLLQEQDYQLIASVTKKTTTQFNQTQLREGCG
jgi:hypothetical protein